MLVKFESRSNRVKGISFHPKRPWILSSLHNGCIQLWDYRMGTLIEKFEEHDGPVRGVAFHHSQPLFVSGGDDYKIKVWNYKQRKCLFTLTGHLDYIRTVFFHHEYPWIVSCSDDQTIRIWNWQSRQCISILTGHNHYVMCAQFHPKEDLLVSASLDQTVRVWDITGLRKKNSAPQSSFPDEAHSMTSRLSSNTQTELFANTDVLIKYVLEGHERGVNWVSFHPNLPLIVSGGDDRQVKLWRMSDTKAWEVDTCRGHYNNVSCAVFHPRQELIVSNSEDRTIRIWDMSKRTAVQSFRRETDRFWILAAHPELNLFAAGHDTGLIVFKLERERPAYCVHQNSLFYIKDKQLRHFDYSSSADNAVIGIRRAAGLNTQPRTLSYNPAENSVLLTHPADGGMFEMYPLPKDYAKVTDPRDASSDCVSGAASSAVFVSRNRYVLLQTATQQLSIRTLDRAAAKQVNLSGTVMDVFYASTGTVLLSTATSVILYDLQQEAQIAEMQMPHAKIAQWSPDGETVALVSKHLLVFANKKLEQLATVSETIRIKSGVWDASGVFVYSTLNHIKYALPQGDHGIIRTLQHTLYITRSHGKNLFCLDRDGKVRVIMIEPTEYRFKLALVKRNYDEVLHIIRNSNLVGQSIIAYLRDKGYPAVALHFVKDVRTRFDLSLECANMDVALETAKELDQDECWGQLASVALKQGNQQIVETAYQRIKCFEKLSFLYVLTGHTDKLRKMMKIAELRGDIISQFHNALYLGDVEEQVKVLQSSGQAPLAYVMAKRHGLIAVADQILTECGKTAEEVDSLLEVGAGSALLVPPVPLFKPNQTAADSNNWPQLAISRGIFESGALMGGASGSAAVGSVTAPMAAAGVLSMDDDAAIGGDWDMDDMDVSGGGGAQPTTAMSPNGGEQADAGGWDIDDDLAVEMAGAQISSAGTGAEPKFVVPSPGVGLNQWWAKNSTLPVDRVASGDFQAAMQMYNQMAAICQFGPIKPMFMAVYKASRASLATTGGGTVSLLTPLHRNWAEGVDARRVLPALPYTLQSVIEILQVAYQAFTAARFTEALELFTRILHMSLFVVVSKRSEVDEIKQLIDVAREYILGLQLELARKQLPTDSPADQKRGVELAAYFTHCRLQAVHSVLSLRLAMAQAFKLKCFQTTSSFVRRLLELGPSPQIAQQARKYQALVEASPRDEVVLAYDPLNPFVLCAASLTPIYKGSVSLTCAFCQASYAPEHQGSICKVCQVSKVGASATGMRWMPA